MKRKLAMLAIIIGAIAIVMAIVCFALSPGDNQYNSSYGGDAYTGIQNAAAQTARNIVRTNTIIKIGFGSLLLVAGIAFGGSGVVNVLTEKKQILVDPESAAQEPHNTIKQ